MASGRVVGRCTRARLTAAHDLGRRQRRKRERLPEGHGEGRLERHGLAARVATEPELGRTPRELPEDGVLGREGRRVEAAHVELGSPDVDRAALALHLDPELRDRTEVMEALHEPPDVRVSDLDPEVDQRDRAPLGNILRSRLSYSSLNHRVSIAPPVPLCFDAFLMRRPLKPEESHLPTNLRKI